MTYDRLHPSAKDTKHAKAFARNTAICHTWPLLERLVATSDSPNYRPHRWLHIPESKVIEPGRFIDFDGDPMAGILPRSFRQAAVVGVLALELDQLQRDTQGVHAVTMKIGEAVVAAPFMQRPDATRLPRLDAQQYAAISRVGEGDVSFGAGIYVPDDGSYIGCFDTRFENQCPIEDLEPGNIFV